MHDKTKKQELLQQISLIKVPTKGRRASVQQFEKQLSRFIEKTEEFTLYSVNGISIHSEFSLDVAVTVEDTLGQNSHVKRFPLTIRAPKNGEFINDLDTIGATNQAPPNLMGDRFLFLNPFSLPGCNFNVKLGL